MEKRREGNNVNYFLIYQIRKFTLNIGVFKIYLLLKKQFVEKLFLLNILIIKII